MTFLEHMREAVERIAVFDELNVEPAVLPGSAMRLSDASVRELLGEAGATVVGFGALLELTALNGRGRLGDVPVHALLTV